MEYGYIRVSTKEQNERCQIDALRSTVRYSLVFQFNMMSAIKINRNYRNKNKIF